MRQHVGSAERDHPEPRRRSDQSVRNFGNRAIAAGGHDDRRAGTRCRTRQGTRVSRAMRLRQLDTNAIRHQDI